MSRIADKYGLTNKYREVGSFKRMTKRGRPRKYLFGPPKQTKKTNYMPKTKNNSISPQIYTSSHTKSNIETVLCPTCNGSHVEKSGSVYLCHNCQATYTSIEQLRKNKLVDMKNIQNYFGLSFTDIFRKTITLTEEGIVITRTKGIWHKFQRIIPYSAVLDIHNHKASLMTAGFFSILTSVGGVAHQSMLRLGQVNDIAEDECSFAYRKKQMKTIFKIIDAIKELQEKGISIINDPLVQYWGMSFTDIFGKKIELITDGIHISKGKHSKIVDYSNVLDVYVRLAEKTMDGGILSIIEKTDSTAFDKIEKLQNSNPAIFMSDEYTLHFNKSSNTEIEKLYCAIETIRREVGMISSDCDFVHSIDGMDGHDFEYFCAELLKKNGFSEVSVTKGSGDQGVDVLATKGGIKYAIQCKNYLSPLGNTPVQEVSAGKIFYNCHVGVVMTNSTFTQGAVDLAKATGTLLWDREYIQGMMK